MDEITTAKEAARAAIRRKRRELDPAWIMEKSDLIQQTVLTLKEFEGARVLCCYLGTPREVQTEQILKNCWQTGRKVCVPACCGNAGEYELVWFEKGDELVPGRWGIQQPRWRTLAQPEEIDVVIVPGLAFDARGNRLGHGGGCYDRIMSRGTARSFFKLGLAFDFQVLDKVPAEKHDVKVDAVVTEKEILRY